MCFVKEGFTPLRKIHMTAAHLWQSEKRLWERSRNSVSNRNRSYERSQRSACWVGAMNNIRNAAEEIILRELIYEEDGA